MSHRAVTFGARARTAPRHWLDGAVPASRYGRAERASAIRHPETPRWVLSSWSEFWQTENPRGLLCGRTLVRTRDASQRQLPTNHEHVVLTHGYQTDHRRYFSDQPLSTQTKN